MEFDCLKYHVGITERECEECFEVDETLKAELQRSDSGYFLDDMEHGIPLQMTNSARDCGDGGIWDVMQKARKNGIRDFYTDFLAVLKEYQQQRLFKYSGIVGDGHKANSFLSIPRQNGVSKYVGMEINPIAGKGATMLLNGVGLWLSAGAGIQVMIFDGRDLNNPIADFLIDPQPDKIVYHTFDTPLELDLSDSDGKPIKYYIVYKLPFDARPKNIKWNCGCGGSRRGWDTYLKGNGIHGTESPTQLFIDGGNRNHYTNGLVIDVNLTCQGMNWLCDMTDFSQGYDRVIARTLQFYGIRKLIATVLNSGKINRYTLLSKEHLYGKRNHLTKEIQSRVAWLAQNLPSNATGCLKCKDGSMLKTTIGV